MDITSTLSTCPYCPVPSRSFTPHGLKIHIGRKHKGVRSHATASQGTPHTNNAGTSRDTPAIRSSTEVLDRLATLRRTVRVLRHIPKGARNLAAGRLCEIIHNCTESNRIEDWSNLLTFAYSALKAPDSANEGNLTTKVKRNIESTTSSLLVLDEGAPLSRSPSLQKTIESKVFEGDLRGAVRVLMSDDSVAPTGPETLAALQTKHPPPSRPLDFPLEPDPGTSGCQFKAEDVALALSSFYNGSAAGLDGIRPAHLKELTSASAGDNGVRLLGSLTKLCNFLLRGQLLPEVCPYIYGASLCALSKKDGGLRPIAVGSTLRRLTAKLGCRAVKEEMAAYLQPHQLGFGTRLGCEAAIHATRAFVTNPENAGNVILKLDIKNAFNMIERDVLLSEVREKIPSLYPFLYQVYHLPSHLYFNDCLISSQVGAQQGDPLGPLVFSLAIHKVISELQSPLNIWYLDDGTIGGRPEVVEQDVRRLLPRLQQLGLEVNTNKCEFFPCSDASRLSFTCLSSLLPGLKQLSEISFDLLGSPIFSSAIPGALEARRRLLQIAQERLKMLTPHVALVLLRMCFAVPKVAYLLRTAPTWLYTEDLVCFDGTLRESVEAILNVRLSEAQWSQASLPIRCGGLGVRRAEDVSLPAFLASAHGVVGLVTDILNLDGGKVDIPFAVEALAAWEGLNASSPTDDTRRYQRGWDEIGTKGLLNRLMGEAAGVDLARLKAVSQPEAGAWLQALPSPHVGTLLDADSLRVAAALRLGCDVCERHECICGSMVEVNGHHALSCSRCAGRFPRHHALNDIVRRALVSANVPCVLEPPGLCRSDGKRPDGMTLVPWQKGKCLLWDATCVSTFAASHIGRTMGVAGAAAEAAASRKRYKYSSLLSNYDFVPLAVETCGCWGVEAKSFISDVGRRLRERGCDPRAGSFLVQRLSLAIQRGNAASVMGTFAPGMTRDGLFD